MQYLISITPDELFLSEDITSIYTTNDENLAPKLSRDEAKETLKMLRRRGYEPLLIRTPEVFFPKR